MCVRTGLNRSANPRRHSALLGLARKNISRLLHVNESNTDSSEESLSHHRRYDVPSAQVAQLNETSPVVDQPLNLRWPRRYSPTQE